ELASSGEVSRGKLTVHARDGSRATREVRTGTCEQSAAALALVVAVAIDPQALLEPAPKNEPPPPPPPPMVPVETARPVDVGADRPQRATRVALGVRWDEISGITPLLRPVLRPFIEILGDRSGVLVPAMRISFAWTRNAHVGLAAGGADFSWY